MVATESIDLHTRRTEAVKDGAVWVRCSCGTTCTSDRAHLEHAVLELRRIVSRIGFDEAEAMGYDGTRRS